ncbi:MAG: hypothetical protein KAH20_02695 [Methylococcales bacterium]|nr:hypothetical protein [Methylococcales bacterium]
MYNMLMTSLLAHKTVLFDEEQIPIFRIQLNKCLALLDEKDKDDLLKIEWILHWFHIKTNIGQTFVNEMIEPIISINNDFIKKISVHDKK